MSDVFVRIRLGNGLGGGQSQRSKATKSQLSNGHMQDFHCWWSLITWLEVPVSFLLIDYWATLNIYIFKKSPGEQVARQAGCRLFPACSTQILLVGETFLCGYSGVGGGGWGVPRTGGAVQPPQPP